MTNRSFEVTMSEWDVMNIIWESGPISANDITQKIKKKKEINDKTVRTLITRLYKKEILKRQKSDGIYMYSTNVNESNIKLKTAKSFINKLYGGDIKSLVLNFAENQELSEKEINELREILNEIKK